MVNIPLNSAEATHELLAALGAQLERLGARFDLVVIGGSALLALGLVARSTRDVDVVAVSTPGGLREADPLPPELVLARDRVARDFGLPSTWLNAGPTSMLRLGLPDGFMERVESRDYGPALSVRFASRIDQIHFKLYATVDRGGKHLADLEALRPDRAELMDAARWSRTHDPSEGYLSVLEEVLAHLGVRDAFDD